MRAWPRERVIVRDRAARATDEVEQFGILELVSAPVERASGVEAFLVVDGQEFPASVDEATRRVRFRFMPKDAKRWAYRIRSNVPALDGQAGEFTSVRPSPRRAAESDPRLPRWWTDDPSPEWSEGPFLGAKTVSRWRAEYLRDFALRLARGRDAAPGARKEPIR